MRDHGGVEFSHPMMIAEPNREKKDFYFPGKNSANETVTTQSMKRHEHFLYYSPLNFPFPSIKEISSPFLLGLAHGSPSLQTQTVILCWSGIYPFCWKKITGRLFVLGQYFGGPYRDPEKTTKNSEVREQKMQYPHWAHYCSLLFSLTLGFKGKFFSCIWAFNLFAL